MAFGSASRRRFHGNQKTVAAARQRLDKAGRVGSIAQRLANLADTEVQTLFEIDEGVAPDALTDVGARQNFPAAANQQFQNPQWLRRQLDAVALPSQLAGRRCPARIRRISESWQIHSSKTHAVTQSASMDPEASQGTKHHISAAQDCKRALKFIKRRITMTLRINDIAPDFEAETTQGRIRFHEFMGDSWCVLFSHPKDFTPVCTTELGYMAGLQPEFEKRNCKIIGLSVDPVADHGKWAVDIEKAQGHKVSYPMIGDSDLKVAKLYGMLPAEAGDTCAGRTAANNATVRTVFMIGPDKKIKLMLVYPMTTGRNFDEVLRVLDSMQLTAKHQVATPVNWKPGDDVIIVPASPTKRRSKKYPAGWNTVLPYLRWWRSRK